jgi:hypothetical protein
MYPCEYVTPLAIVQTSAFPNKTSWKWRHHRRNVAVIITDGRESVAMISTRARGVRSIDTFWGGLYAGPSRWCLYECCLVKARARAAELNARFARHCVGGGTQRAA